MTKKFFLILLLTISVLGISQYTQTNESFAADASRFDPGRLIDDRTFTDTSTMNASQIQNFLNTVNGIGSTCLKNYTTKKPLGNSTYGGDVSAAQAIYDMSQMYEINPQVILVTLQKEQSLITKTSCGGSTYKSAMGFGCPDTAPCDDSKAGLSIQLYEGTRHLRNFFNNNPNWFVPFKVGTYFVGWHPDRARCGGTNLNIQTRGTAALYSYTPYQPNAAALSNLYGTGDGCSSYGNRNFWRDFSDWFGSPTGDLVRTVNNSTVYLLVNNKKYTINSLGVLNDFGVLGPVGYVDQSYLDSIPTANTLTRMVGSTGNGTIYLIIAGIKLPFTSCASVADFGFSCGSVNKLTPAQLDLFVNGPIVTPLIKSNTNSTIYFVKDNKKRPIASWQDLMSIGIGAGFNVLTDPFIDSIPTGDILAAGGSLVKSSDSSTVYAVNNWSESPSLFPVSSFNYTIDLGLGTEVKVVPSSQIASYGLDPLLKSTFKCNSNYYIGTNGQLFKLDPSEFANFGYTAANFLNGGDICNRFSISQVPMSRFILNNGSIYFVENGTKQGFTSWNAYLAKGGQNSPLISVSNTFASSLPTGPVISGS